MIKLKANRPIIAFLLFTLAALTMMTTPISSSTQTPNIKVVYAGKLIDAVTDQVRTNVSVIIENGRIR